MTDYPTAAEIDAAANTIEALQNCVDRGVPAWGVTWSGLETAREILRQLDAVPGVLHYPDAEPEPEPEPKPTAAEVLGEAYERAIGHGLPAEMQILGAALTYAEENPQWFRAWHEFNSPIASLDDAKNHARDYNRLGWATLIAAREVATSHPELFGGDA